MKQIELADEPMKDAMQVLSKYPKVVQILQELYPRILPFLIKGHEDSPIHHIAYVVKFMALITTSEKNLSASEVKRGVLAALLHDIGIGECILKKITERMIQDAPPEKRDVLRKAGIEARLEHMKKGEDLSKLLLEEYATRNPAMLSREEITPILDIVSTHDNCKIPMMEEKVDKKWLLRPPPDDWLKQCHWEADALWMLTPAGILVDLEREQYEDTPENRRKRFRYNFGLHKKIVNLYREAYKDEVKEFEFRDGTLYRTDMGCAQAAELMWTAETA